MTRNVQVIKLLAAVSIAIAACLFVATYDDLSHTRFRFDHPGDTLTARPPAAEFVTGHRIHAFAVPLESVAAGSDAGGHPDHLAVAELARTL